MSHPNGMFGRMLFWYCENDILMHPSMFNRWNFVKKWKFSASPTCRRVHGKNATETTEPISGKTRISVTSRCGSLELSTEKMAAYNVPDASSSEDSDTPAPVSDPWEFPEEGLRPYLYEPTKPRRQHTSGDGDSPRLLPLLGVAARRWHTVTESEGGYWWWTVWKYKLVRL